MQIIDFQIGLAVGAAKTDNRASVSEGTLYQGVGGCAMCNVYNKGGWVQISINIM